jgi:hypothetical protein
MPTALGVTVTVELLTAADAIPLQPEVVNGAVPPTIVTGWLTAALPAKPMLFGETAIGEGSAVTVTLSGPVIPLLSATTSTQPPGAVGLTVSVLPEIDPVATLPQPVTVYGAWPPEIVTCCAGAVGFAKVTLEGLKPIGGAVPTRILAIIPPSSWARM